ncbi:MAG: DUF3619 family protein [Gammaproteobacteria bacterium]|nr:DUF3619 family protein [Gammaproteobacteria bacterium]
MIRNKLDEEQFLQKVRKQLDESADSLDAATLSRLNQARQRALTQRAPRNWNLWLPAAAMATVVAALIGGNLLLQQPDTENHAQQFAFEDVELLTSDADIDLLLDMDMLEVMADDAS